MPESSWSLARRLSWRLAVQTLLGTALVSLLVWTLTATHLARRGSEVLQEKRVAVEHLLSEARSSSPGPELLHRLNDYFGSHDDLWLDLRAADGTPWYRSPRAPDVPGEAAARFSVQLVDAQGLTLVARLGRETRTDQQLLDHLALSLAASSLLGVVGISVAGWLQVRRGLRPVADLTRQTQSLSADKLHQRLSAATLPGELLPLVTQFNALLERLEATYRQLEGFNADVAHELNSPLATLITGTELALRKPRDPQTLRDLLADHLEELQRLSAIVRDMLFLARADRGATARRETVASLAATGFDVLAYFEAALLEANLRAEVRGDASADVDLSLMKRALSNLVANAIRYGCPGSRVTVEISASDDVCLCVSNEGPAIDGEHLHRIFDRFFRADASRTEAGAHHGLGLAIVAAVARMHDGQPWARSGNGRTQVGLCFPATATAERQEQCRR